MPTGYIPSTITYELMSQPENKEQKIAFNMVIDRPRAIIIKGLLNAAYENPFAFMKLSALFQKHNIDVDSDFLIEFETKYHECGFCNDPNCTWDADEDYLNNENKDD